MKFLEVVCPTLILVLQVLAALGYVPSKNWGLIIYWSAAAVLTYAVTYLMGK